MSKSSASLFTSACKFSHLHQSDAISESGTEESFFESLSESAFNHPVMATVALIALPSVLVVFFFLCFGHHEPSRERSSSEQAQIDSNNRWKKKKEREDRYIEELYKAAKEIDANR